MKPKLHTFLFCSALLAACGSDLPAAGSLISGDFNGDGNQDVVVFYFDGNAQVFFGDGVGNLDGQDVFDLQNDLSISVDISNTHVVDVDADGRQELLVSGFPSFGREAVPFDGNRVTLLAIGDDGAITSQQEPDLQGRFVFSILIGDWNADGRSEFAFQDGSSLFFYTSDAATGTLLFDQEVVIDGFSVLNTVELGADRATDVLMFNGVDSTIVVLKNDGTGSSYTNVDVSSILTAESFSTRVADLNGDDLLDLVSVEGNQLKLLVQEANTDAYVTAATIPLDNFFFINNIVVGDTNADGLDDVVLQGFDASAQFFLAESTGPGDYQTQTLSTENAIDSFTLSDLHNDGRADLVTIQTSRNALTGAGFSDLIVLSR